MGMRFRKSLDKLKKMQGDKTPLSYYKKLPANTRMIDIHDTTLFNATMKVIDNLDAVYTEDIVRECGLFPETIVPWLKREGFVKAGAKASHRWQNVGWRERKCR